MNPKQTQTKDLRIAIIGAGVAGLTAAHRLRELGYHNLTIYEREPVAGGKVCSYQHDGRWYELGALWSSPRYRVNGKFAQQAGATSTGARLPGVLEAGTVRSYTQYARHHFEPQAFAAAFFQLCKALWRYPGLAGPDLLGTMAGSADNFAAFSAQQGFGPVAHMASSFFAGCGYRQNDAVPAPYLMKLMHIFLDVLVLDVSGLSKTRMRTFDAGWQSLWQQLARTLDVRYGCSIASVRRYTQDGAPKVEVAANGTVEVYDRLVVAAPLDSCGSYLDLEPEERELFGKIRTHPFRVTLVEGHNLPHASLMDNAPRSRSGHIHLVVQQHPGIGVYTIYQQLEGDIDTERANTLMYEDIAAMGGSVSCVLTSKTWQYFPHVGSDDLRAGFYQRLEDLQGSRGTCYVGSVLNMETVEATAMYSISLMDKHFGAVGRDR
jgi:hypothetical protein